jgi:hypothetical protein
MPAGLWIHRRHESDESSGKSNAKRDSSPLRDLDIIVLEDAERLSVAVHKPLEISVINEKNDVTAFDQKKSTMVTVEEIEEKKGEESERTPAANSKPPIAAPKQRVDYLAGLVSSPSFVVRSLTCNRSH